MTHNAEDLLCEITEGVATLTFNRPASRNSLTPDYLLKLIDALQRCDRDDAALLSSRLSSQVLIFACCC